MIVPFFDKVDRERGVFPEQHLLVQPDAGLRIVRRKADRDHAFHSVVRHLL